MNDALISWMARNLKVVQDPHTKNCLMVYKTANGKPWFYVYDLPRGNTLYDGRDINDAIKALEEA